MFELVMGLVFGPTFIFMVWWIVGCIKIGMED